MVGDGGGSDIIFIQDDSTVQGTLTAIDRRHAKKTGNCSNGAKSHTAGRHKRIKHAAQMKISGFIHGSPGLLRLLLIGWSLLLLDGFPGSLSEEKTWIALDVCLFCTVCLVYGVCFVCQWGSSGASRTSLVSGKTPKASLVHWYDDQLHISQAFFDLLSYLFRA